MHPDIGVMKVFTNEPLPDMETHMRNANIAHNKEENSKTHWLLHFPLPSSWNSSDELAFIPMQLLKPDGFMFLSQIGIYQRQ